MELSLAGIIGAMVGTIASAAIYWPLAAMMERNLKGGGANPERRATSEAELALLRRLILAAVMLLCAGIGYWIGRDLGG